MNYNCVSKVEALLVDFVLVIAPLTRSVEKDLETQIVVVTSNEELRDRLQRERDDLFKHGTLVNAQVQYQL